MSPAVPPGPPRGLLRRPWRLGEYVALDFEATGLDLRRDRIISFGSVPIRVGRVDLGEARYQLVDPAGQRPSAGTIVIHGIRPMDLDGAPSEEAAREVLRGALRGAFIVGWFAGIEAHFLSVLFGGSKERWLRRTIDTRDLLRVHVGEAAADLSLAEAAERFGIPVADPHHALDDALVTAQLFLVLASHLARGGMVRTVGDLLATRPPALPVLRRPRAPI